MAKAKEYSWQHHVPATYLSAWCDPKKEPKETPFVWRFTPDGELIGRKSPANLFAETDFYTIPLPRGGRGVELEQGLNQLETHFATIRGKLAKHQLLDVRDVTQLLAFMVAMKYRTKAVRDHQRDQWGKVCELADSVRKQFADGRPSPPGYVSADAVPVDFEELEELKTRPTQQLLPLQIELTLPIFRSMDVAVCEVDEEPGLITCDNPVFVFEPELWKLPPSMRYENMMGDSVEITMPISPKQIILLNRKGVAGYCKSDRKALEEWNRRAVANAAEEVIANTKEKQDAWFTRLPPPEDRWENTEQGKAAFARKAAWEERVRGLPRIK